METVISTEQVSPGERLDLWGNAVKDNLTACSFQCPAPLEFSGSLRPRSLSFLRATQVTTVTQHTVGRSPSQALEASNDCYLAAIGLAGRALLRQDGREALLEPGDLALYDANRHFQFDIGGGHSTLILRFPRELLQRRISRTERMMAVRLTSASELVQLFTDFAVRFFELRGQFGALITQQLADQTLDLLAAVLMDSTHGAGSGLSMGRTATLYRIKCYVEMHLQDPDLSPAKVARAMNTSCRYVHKLFQSENTSLMRYVWDRRLERCRGDLANLAKSADGVSQVAFKWGFNELSHFSRAFKARFGLPPREYRRQAEPLE